MDEFVSGRKASKLCRNIQSHSLELKQQDLKMRIEEATLPPGGALADTVLVACMVTTQEQNLVCVISYLSHVAFLPQPEKGKAEYKLPSVVAT